MQIRNPPPLFLSLLSFVSVCFYFCVFITPPITLCLFALDVAFAVCVRHAFVFVFFLFFLYLYFDLFFCFICLFCLSCVFFCTIKHWDKDVCLNFADRCLSFLKDNVDEGVRYSFKYLDPYDEVTLEPIVAPAVAPAAGNAAMNNICGTSVKIPIATTAATVGGI